MSAHIERRVVGKNFGPISVETRDGGKEMFVGYGAVFEKADSPGTVYKLWDNVYERIAPGAFDRALSEKHDARGLFNHNADNLLGRVSNNTMRLSVDSVGLRYEIDVDPEDIDHQKVKRKIVRGDLSGSSFAFVPTSVNWTQEQDKEWRTILDLDLYDTGPVTYPAYEGTSVATRAENLVSEARSEHAAWKATQTEATPTEASERSDEAALEVVEGTLAPVIEDVPVAEASVVALTATVVEPVAEEPVTLERDDTNDKEHLAYLQRKLIASQW